MYELRFYTCSELFLHHLKNILNTSNIPLTEFVSGFGQEKKENKDYSHSAFLNQAHNKISAFKIYSKST
jgi:hypothetical protein